MDVLLSVSRYVCLAYATSCECTFRTCFLSQVGYRASQTDDAAGETAKDPEDARAQIKSDTSRERVKESVSAAILGFLSHRQT
jgi:hypothetical protein